MLTYLDRQIKANPLTSEDLEWLAPLLARFNGSLRQGVLDNAVEAMELRCAASLFALELAGRTGRFPLDPVLLEHTVWHSAIAPFLCASELAPLALAPEREVIEAFRDTRPSEDVRSFAVGALAEHRGFYVDVPQRSVPLGCGRLELRAIFGIVEGTRIHFSAVLTAAGEGSARRLHWMPHCPETKLDNLHHPRAAAMGASRTGGPLLELGTLLDQEKIDIAELRTTVEDLALLCVTHAKTAAGGEQPAWLELPHMARDDVRRQGRRAGANAKKFSLFRVQRLEARGLRRDGTCEPSAPTGIQQSVRSRVTGHYRLQAHGPRHSLRRLTWIAEHMRGPVDAPMVTPLVRLSGDDLAPAAHARAVIDAPPMFEAFEHVGQTIG